MSQGVQFRYPVVLPVAWTVADLAGHTVPGADDAAEALGMRLQRAVA
jgi:magnesium chelatase family protein